MADRDADNSGVIVRPPLLYIGFLVLGLALDHVWPMGAFTGGIWRGAGYAPIVLGFGGLGGAMWHFRRAGTNVETYKPSTTVVRSGLYRFSRNPIYISLGLIYAGIAIAAGSPWALALLIPLLVVIRYGVIAREERYLEEKFGADYLGYKQSTRRWL